MMSHCLGPAHRSLRPQRLYTVLHFLHARAAVTSTMSQKQSPCSVFRYKTEHKSLHFLPTSKPLKTQRITFIFQGHAPQNAPKCIYICANYFTPDGFLNVISMYSACGLTVFMCTRYQSILIDQRRASKISSRSCLFGSASKHVLQRC